MGKEVIWGQPMSPPQGTNPDLSEWTFNGATTRVYRNANSACPSSGACWALTDRNNDPNPYLYRIDSTAGYRNIELIYSIHAQSNINGNESCQIAYNVNNAGDSNWIVIANYSNSDGAINAVFSLPRTARDDSGVGIKLSIENGDGTGNCRVNNWYLIGEPFTYSPSSQPTDTSPEPTPNPSESPSESPTKEPTVPTPTTSPSDNPSTPPSPKPTDQPTKEPSVGPSQSPSEEPSQSPTKSPNTDPTSDPTKAPTNEPSRSPSPTPAPQESLVVGKLITKPPSTAPTEAAANVDEDQDFGTDTEVVDSDLDGNISDLGKNTEEESSGSSLSNLAYLIIGIVGVLLIGCCIILLWYLKGRRNKKDKLEKETSYLEATIPSTSPTDVASPDVYKHTNPNVMHSITSMTGSADGPQINATSPNSPISNQTNSNYPTSVEMSNMEAVKSASSLISSNFEANLTNLTGANDLLMDDIVDDMEMRNNGDVEIIGRTPGGDMVDMGDDNVDITESTNVDDDAVNQDDTGDFDDDDDVIGGYETLGGPQSPNNLQQIQSKHQVQASNLSMMSSHESDDDVIGGFETLGGPKDNDEIMDNEQGFDHGNNQIVNVHHYNENNYDNNNFHQNQFNDGYGNNALHQNQYSYNYQQSYPDAMNNVNPINMGNINNSEGVKKIRINTDSDMVYNGSHSPRHFAQISAMDEEFVNDAELDDIVIGIDHDNVHTHIACLHLML